VDLPNGRTSRTLAALVAAAVLLAVGYPLASPAAPERGRPKGPRQASVTVHGHTVRAALGTNCLPGKSSGGYMTYVCADADGTPGTKRRLAVAPRDRVLITVGARARHVDVGLVRSTPNGQSEFGWRKARRRAGHPRQWVTRLPGRLRGADILDAAVRYRDGDADFGVSIRRRR
jgi:hypothetical protein